MTFTPIFLSFDNLKSNEFVIFFLCYSYEIMVKCWYENPTHRPSFADLVIELELLLEELTSQVSTYTTDFSTKRIENSREIVFKNNLFLYSYSKT